MRITQTLNFNLYSILCGKGPILGLGGGPENETGIGSQQPQPRQFGLGVPAELFVDTLLSLYKTQVQILGINSFTLPHFLLPGPVDAVVAEFNVSKLEIHGLGNIARFGPITTQIGLLSSSLRCGMELVNIGSNFDFASIYARGNISYNCPSITLETTFIFKTSIPFPKIGLEAFTLNTISCNGTSGEEGFISTTIVELINAGQTSFPMYLNEKMNQIFGNILGDAAQVVFG